MAWEVKVSFDEDKTDVGLVSVIFTDIDTTTFSFSQRIQATAAGRNAFVAEAMAARTAWQAKKIEEASGVDSVKARFVAQGEAVI